MFDSNLNWNYSNMLPTPWVLSAINPNSDAARMVVQVQTQSSSYSNPERSLLTNTIEWFSSGNQPQTGLPTLLDDCKTNPETALVSYGAANNTFINNGANGAYINANNTLVALPQPAPATVPAILTLTVPSLDYSRSVVLQAPVPSFARALPSHDQSTYVTRIIRNVPVQDPIAAMVQGSAGQILSAPASPTFISGLPSNVNQCLRLPFMGGAAVSSIAEVPQPPQNTWVMVMPNKDDVALPEEKVETTPCTITELPSTCSSCGSVISSESSEFSTTDKCSTCMEITAIPSEYTTNEAISDEPAITEPVEPVCTCGSADKLDWNENPCQKCKTVLQTREISYESDPTCQAITTTSVEAGIQAGIEPNLDSTFDSEHEEFEPTSQAISTILRKLLEEEIENTNKETSDKTFDIEEDPVDNASFIDLNQLDTTQDECDGPTNGVKDVLMTGAPSCVKRHLTESQSRAKKVKTVLETAMRRPTCTKCGDKFSSTFNLRKHYMSQVNDKSYQCGKCKQTFTGCYSYKRHSWTHDKDLGDDPPPENEIIPVSESSDEEGIQPYGCAQCGKEFSDCFLLTEHCATHVRGRPFTCTQCDMCFESVAQLEKHSKIHARTKTVLFNGYEAESESSSE